MSDATKAVFLSYASQDAEAARRICDALRAAGVEVWFDQSELRGGDAWDQKIRKQIKECALFVPVISANTQARAEGYFRLEWKLAVDRSHLLADDHPFLFPIAIGDVSDATARVPDKFREVQWTKLRLDETPAELAARVRRLLEAGANLEAGRPRVANQMEAGRPRPASERGEGTPPPTKLRRGWLRYGWAAVGILFGLIYALRPLWQAPHRGEDKPPVVVSPTEARQLVAKAWEQMNKPGLARAELEVADELCRRATELEPDNADAWAAWSQVDSWYIYHNLDHSTERREGARKKAARAMELAPHSYEARLAQACNLVRGVVNAGNSLKVSQFGAEADGLLRGLLQEKPDEPRALHALGILLRNSGKIAEAREVFGRLGKNPAFAATAWNELGWAEWINRDYRAAEAAADASIALQPFWGNLSLKMSIAQSWWGDLDLAKATMDRIPVAVQQEDQCVAFAVHLYYWRREPENMLRVLNDTPRDWLQSNGVDGPKAYFAALAQQMAGHEEAARVQWQKALMLVEQRLADQPDSGDLLYWKGLLLTAMGQRSEAETALRLAREMGDKISAIADAGEQVRLGNLDAAIALLERAADDRARFVTAASYRLNPLWDPLRDQPRFKALLARMEAAPRFSPTAPEKPVAAAAVTPDEKSVVVLPFANLSGDPAQEYFSDGLTEEILNALARERDLRVVPRTSAFSFKGKNLTLPEIARALNVAQVVEGSVRRAGNTVRIDCTLTRVADGFAQPLPQFEREMKDASGIFALEDDVARAVVEKLTGRGTARPVVVQTRSPAAFDLYLQARSLVNTPESAQTRGVYDRVVELLEKSVALDPSFAPGWALLSFGHVRIYGANWDHSDVRLEKARTAIETAQRLAPEDPTVIQFSGSYYYYGFRDYARARERFERVARLLPNGPEAPFLIGIIDRREGKWAHSLANTGRAVELDPVNLNYLSTHFSSLLLVRRFDDAMIIARRLAALRPGDLTTAFQPAYVAFAATGSLGEGDDFVARLPRSVADSPEGVAFRKQWAQVSGRFAEFIHLDQAQPYFDGDGTEHYLQASLAAVVYEAAGDIAGARTRLAGMPEELRARLEREPRNTTLWQRLGQMHVLLGNTAEAERCLERAFALLPENADAIMGVDLARTRAWVWARTGQKGKAIAEYARFLTFPGGPTVHQLRYGAMWAPLRGDAHWEALLNDPKNNAPLY